MLKLTRYQLKSSAMAVLTVALASIITSLLQPLITPNIFPLFYPAVMVSTLYGGRAAGLLATILSILVCQYFFLPPVYSLNILALNAVVRIATFAITILLIVGISSELRNTKQRNERILYSLKESEERYRILTENLPQLVWTARADGFVEYFNQRWLNYTGFKLDESLGWGWQKAIHPEDLSSTLEQWNNALLIGNQIEVQYRLRRKDGVYCWHITQALPLRDQKGQIVNWFGTCTDIQAQKEAEAILYHREQEFKTLAENSVDIISRIARNFRYLYINPAVEKATGIPSDNFIGKTNVDLGLPAEICQLWEDKLTEIFVTKKPLYLEYYFPTPSGRRYYQSQIVPEFGLDKSVNSVVCISRDLTEYKLAQENITQQKRIEEALRESEERFWIAQELSLDAFTIMRSVRDATGKIIDFEWQYVNPKAAEILEKPAEELIGRYLLQVLPGNKTNSELFDLYVQVVETGEPHDIEVFYNAEGITGWFRNMSVKLNDGVAISFGDITKRKQAEVERINLLERERAARAEAEAANRIKDEFLAVLSHELRSPLNPILGWAKLLRTRNFDAKTTERALETIERNAKLQTQLIDDLLDVSRILRGKLSLNISTVDLIYTIEAAIETVQLAAEAKSINLKFSIEDFTWKNIEKEQLCISQTESDKRKFLVLGDPNRLQQIIWNIVSNAVKFTPPGGFVEVKLSAVNSSLEDSNEQATVANFAQIQVTDTGKGINPDFVPYVFDYFRQENSSTTRQFGGLGLGLAIVRTLTEMHGGKVFAASKGEGQGATFTVQLPLIVELPEIEPNKPQLNNSLDLNGIKILVVDDDADMRDFLAFMLNQYGAEVTTVASAIEALEILSKFQPNLLLSDIGMPEVDGYSFIRQVRSLPAEKGGKIPAIALTAYASEADYKQALAAGFQKHIAKPVEPTELAKAVANLLKNNLIS